MPLFDFKNLFVFEMANNHQGSVEHGQRIIGAMANVAAKHNVRAAIKLQFRDLDTFIHPDFRESRDNKHIPRFLSTRLSEEEFAKLAAATKSRGLITMCTPFDEPSVDRIIRLGIEVIKIGSCSAHDWPLLERVAEVGRPVIISTGGLTIKDIDKIVSFFQKRAVHFALMHCVSIYPMTNDKAHLNQIEILRVRYPDLTIGFSTHEEPSNTTLIGLAYAKGARIFEKHVGVATPEIKLNAYSATPEQADLWVASWHAAVKACGYKEGERDISEEEIRDLKSLMRGVYAKRRIEAGTVIDRSDVFFAIPLADNQLVSGRWKDGLMADKDYLPKESISSIIRSDVSDKKEIIYHAIHSIKGMLNMAKVPLGHDFQVELSHHHGIDNFHKAGCALITCFNREYAKKIVVQLAGQYNPAHYHMKKDETFHILSGVLKVDIDGRQKVLEPGDSLWVPRGVLHAFGSDQGVIFEEISTTNHPDDSYYADKEIAKLPRDFRKTYLLNWGRHQFD